MKTQRKKFDKERIIEFCKLVNAGMKPKDALAKMKACQGYQTALKRSGIYYQVGDNYYAVERLTDAKYDAFKNIRYTTRKKYNTKSVNQYELPILRQPRKKKQLNTIQKFIKNIFKI
jgi:hypothetical protein